MSNPFEEIGDSLNNLEGLIKQLFSMMKSVPQYPSMGTVKSLKYYSRRETADMLNISLTTLSNWVKQSRIKCHKIGGRALFLESDITSALHPIVPL